jgi:hypothetical protein
VLTFHGSARIYSPGSGSLSIDSRYTRLIRRPDRILAAQLHERGVPLTVLENALALAAVRRMIRPNGAAPLATVRSLAYFLPAIDEVLATDVDPSYYQHVRSKLQRLTTSR